MSENSELPRMDEEEKAPSEAEAPAGGEGSAPAEGSVSTGADARPAQSEAEGQEAPEQIRGEDVAGGGAPSLEAGPAAEPTGEPKGLSRFLRAALRSLTIFVVVFGLGVLATWFARVHPQSQALSELQVERDSILARAEEIDSRLVTLEAENRQLQGQVDGLEEQLAAEEATRQQVQSHLGLLKVLVDVNSAQLAVEQDEAARAKEALATTDDRLTALETQIEGVEPVQFQDLRERLRLALDSIGNDTFAAQRDLEVLANKLLALEELAFGS